MGRTVSCKHHVQCIAYHATKVDSKLNFYFQISLFLPVRTTRWLILVGVLLVGDFVTDISTDSSNHFLPMPSLFLMSVLSRRSSKNEGGSECQANQLYQNDILDFDTIGSFKNDDDNRVIIFVLSTTATGFLSFNRRVKNRTLEQSVFRAVCDIISGEIW